MFTRASTSPADPGDCGGWGYLATAAPSPGARLFGPRHPWRVCRGALPGRACLVLGCAVGGARRWTWAGTSAGGWAGGSPGLCPSTHRSAACCGPRACTRCSPCCTSAAPLGLTWDRLRRKAGDVYYVVQQHPLLVTARVVRAVHCFYQFSLIKPNCW